jgi:hypothetical protein
MGDHFISNFTRIAANTCGIKYDGAKISLGGRARWKVENEMFNTLKNQSYQFEHNFGHGYKHLSHVFGLLMFLAFLIDQVQQRCCGLFQAALAKMKRKLYFWNRLRAVFQEFYTPTT